MKKSTVTILATLLCVSYGVLSWDIVTHSEPPGPEDSQYARLCSQTTTSDNAGPDTSYDMCCIDYNEAMEAAKKDWHSGLQALIDQEVAASKMVEDGYESLRTYNCWLEYICLSVQYSGHAPIESVLGTGITSEHIGSIPGCQDPENIRMETEYNNIMRSMEEIPIASLVPAVAQHIDSVFEENKLNYFPRCQTDGNNNASPNITLAKSRYDACKNALELNFGCPPDVDQVFCPEFSNAFVTLESVLQKAHGDQKAAALERKLETVVTGLKAMEEHVNYFSRFLSELDARFSCYAGKCS